MTPQNCEYFLIYYTPSAAADLRLPIGIVLFGESGALVRYGFAKNWRALRFLDRAADPAFLQALPEHFAKLGGHAPPEDPENGATFRDGLMGMAANDSGTVQVSQPRGVETADPDREFTRLFAEHVERRRAPAVENGSLPTHRPGSRRWIQDRLGESLRQHQLWDRFGRNVGVEQFTAPGDGFRIDYAWQPNGVRKFLHAVSLDQDWNQAKVLSYTFWRIRQRIPAQLTAVVGDSDRTRPSSANCRQLLLDAGIALLPLSGLDEFLQQTRAEFS